MGTIKPTSTELKIWFRLYIAVLLCYTPFFCTFIWGNHDWAWIKTETPLLSGLFEGRFSQFIIPTILYESKILPILSLLTGLTFFCISSLLLLKLWQIPINQITYIFLAFNLVAAPYTISWLYFAFLTLSCLTWPLFIVSAFFILEYSKHSIFSLITSILLFTSSLGGYPPVINLISVILFTLILNDLCFKKMNPKYLIPKYTYHIIAILTSIILLFLIQYFLKISNLQFETYNTTLASFKDIYPKLIKYFNVIFLQFIVTTSFIEYIYKYIMLCIVLLALIKLYIELPKRTSYILCYIAGSLGFLLSSIITLLVSQETSYVLYEPRIEFFYLPYIYVFSAAVLIRSSQSCIRNLTILALLLSGIYCFNTTANAAKVWKLGFNAETNLSERIISRIENLDNFYPQTQKYTFIQGGNINFRQKYYPTNQTTKIDSYTLSAPYIPWHLPTKAYMFYYPYFFTEENSYDTLWSFIPPSIFDNHLEIINYIRHDITEWPHLNSIYFTDNFIILTLTAEGSGYAQNWLYKYF